MGLLLPGITDGLVEMAPVWVGMVDEVVTGA